MLVLSYAVSETAPAMGLGTLLTVCNIYYCRLDLVLLSVTGWQIWTDFQFEF
jgi:hypothetical protein